MGSVAGGRWPVFWLGRPSLKTDLVQQVDVRDLTEFMIHLLENGNHGVFNITDPAAPLTMEEFVYGMRAATSSEVSWTWWYHSDAVTDEQRATPPMVVTPEREKEILEAWKARGG